MVKVSQKKNGKRIADENAESEENQKMLEHTGKKTVTKKSSRKAPVRSKKVVKKTAPRKPQKTPRTSSSTTSSQAEKGEQEAPQPPQKASSTLENKREDDRNKEIIDLINLDDDDDDDILFNLPESDEEEPEYLGTQPAVGLKYSIPFRKKILTPDDEAKFNKFREQILKEHQEELGEPEEDEEDAQEAVPKASKKKRNARAAPKRKINAKPRKN